MHNFIATFFLFITAQVLAWIQANGQFNWEIFRKMPFAAAFLIGGLSAYLFALAHKYSYQMFSGVVWPGRMFAFSTGIVIFTIMTWLIMGEEITLKTGLSIILALCILLIQFYL
jgi:hypothetical protein